MAKRTAESMQVMWQARFQDHQLNPFTTDAKLSLRYQRLDNPASWWHNPLNPDSLRLTKPAFNILQKQTKILCWKFNLDRAMLPKTLIQLEKYFTSPYYILTMKTIWVYGETETMMLALHGNNLQQYLDNQVK
jgi:hypothetical protein